ncbi:MAG TPA: carboxypeptidase-like regulatory domain-containing protein [Terracidiphilus sp.]|nr:carboxypeptidase-like regulatory domain-containing protein [Terracidiphilus sp.]
MPASRLKVAILVTAISAGACFADGQGAVGVVTQQGGVSTGTGFSDSMLKATVHGVVLDRVTKQPIARALVDGAFDAVLTDSEGRFELTLPVGVANIQVRRPGYGSRNGEQQLIHVSFAAPALTLYLTPSAGVSGQVSLKGDDDPTMIRIAAYRKGVNGGHEMWRQTEIATPESDGTFRFPMLDAPGSYIFCTSAISEPGTRNGKRMGFPSKCFPGGTDFLAATPLELAAGQKAQIDMDLEPQPFYAVTISVPSTDRMPGIQIYERSGFRVPSPRILSRAPGTMEFQLPNGSYYADARLRGAEQAYGRVDFTVANRPLELSIPLVPLRPVPVVIHKDFTEDANTNTNPQGLVRLDGVGEGNPGFQLTLQAAGRVPGGGGFGGAMRHVDGGGPDAFEVEAEPGRWRMQVFSLVGYVSSITSGGVDLLRDPLVIGAGSIAQPIEVTMRNDGGKIECRLMGASPADATQAGATAGGSGDGFEGGAVSYEVVAIAQFPAATQIQIASVSGEMGQPVTIANLAPGDYRVAAFDRRPEIDLDDKEQVAHKMAAAQLVHVQANGTATAQVTLTKLGGGLDDGMTGAGAEQ